LSKSKYGVAAVAAGLLVPLAVTAPADAYAGTPGCVTVREYRSVTNGMTQAQVAARFGIRRAPVYGRVTFRYDSQFIKEVDREYRICNAAGRPRPLYRGAVTVDFAKEADWETGEFPPGPLLSVRKSRYAF
jgi:hypothetical protein